MREDLVQNATEEAWRSEPSPRRPWKVGLAALSGGALMLYSGGLAAPSIAGSLFALCTAGSTIGAVGTTAATVATSVTAAMGVTISSTAAITAMFSASGAGLAGYKMKKRVAGVKEFFFLPLYSEWPIDAVCLSSEQGSTGNASETGLPVFICVPGWREDGDDPRRVWGGYSCVGGVPKEATARGSRDMASSQHSTLSFTGFFGDEQEQRERKPQQEQKMDANDGDKSEEGSNDDPEWEGVHGGWWRDYVPGGEEHVLVWETSCLQNLGIAMNRFIHHNTAHFAVEVMPHMRQFYRRSRPRPRSLCLISIFAFLFYYFN